MKFAKWLAAVTVATVSMSTAQLKAEEINEDAIIEHSSTFSRLGVAALPCGETYIPAPALSVGHRLIEDNHGVDCSVDFSGVQKHIYNEEAVKVQRTSFYYSAKALFLGFAQPEQAASVYYGLGASFGGIHTEVKQKHTHFDGLFANAAIGYEMNIFNKARNTLHFDCAVPLLPVAKQGSIPGPIYQVSVGFNY